MRYDDRMSDFDRIMWVIEKNPLLRSTITAITLLDRTPDRARVMQRVDRATRNIPRLRQRVVWNPYSIAPPRWEFDPNFDLSYHVRFASAGGDNTFDDVVTFVEPMVMQSFDRDRPLWEFVVIENMVDGQAALITKLHHTITDGIGAVRLLLELVDLEPDPVDEADMPPEPDIVVLNQVQRFRSAVRHEALRQKEFVQQGFGVVDRLRDDPATTTRGAAAVAGSVRRAARSGIKPLSPLMVGRSTSSSLHTFDVEVKALKTAARIAHAKLNDALVVAVANGIARYHEAMGAPVDRLRMGMAINNRFAERADRSGNEFVPARFEVPIAIEDPIEHMRTVRDLIRSQRAEPMLSLMEPLASLVSRLPRFVVTNLFTAALSGQDFNVSNVPGADIEVYFAGSTIVAQYPIGPLGGAAVNVTLLSYLDTAYIGLNLDRAAITEIDLFVDCIQQGLEAVVHAGRKPTRKQSARKAAPRRTKARR
ncbi:MAG: wax ester/triacylglycerol synthase domain-containing protein [Acidimicrobiales bacterium]